MNVDCTLNTFAVPGFSGLSPEFGIKKPNGESISSREAHNNIALPFALMRPHIVNENSTTTQVEVNSVFDTTVAGVTLSLSNATYNGCMAYIINSSGDTVSVVINGGTAIRLFKNEFLDLEFVNGKWVRRSAAETSHADMVDGAGRNLLEVLGVNTIPEAMAEIRRRCNNNNELDASKIPDFSGIRIGDYIDGIDLSGCSAAPGGSAPQAWNDTYKNNRLVVSGFNTYKGVGSTENTKNHILFTFRNIVCQGRINSTDTNANGYKASEMMAWLEGASGNGSGAFATKLKEALGDYLYSIQKYHSKKGGSVINVYTVWLPTEIEVWGRQTYGDELNYYNTNIHFPIYQKSYVYLIKRYNGSRSYWWLSTPTAASSTGFCNVDRYGGANHSYAHGWEGGVAPAFCVA